MKWKDKYCFEQEINQILDSVQSGLALSALPAFPSSPLPHFPGQKHDDGRKVFVEGDCPELIYSPILFVCRKESQNKPNLIANALIRHLPFAANSSQPGRTGLRASLRSAPWGEAGHCPAPRVGVPWAGPLPGEGETYKHPIVPCLVSVPRSVGVALELRSLAAWNISILD